MNSKLLDKLAAQITEVDIDNPLPTGVPVFLKDVESHPANVTVYPEAEKELAAVDRTLHRFTTVQESTVRELLDRAETLEAIAADLRQRASIIQHQATQIPEDYRNAVQFELRARAYAQALKELKPEWRE